MDRGHACVEPACVVKQWGPSWRLAFGPQPRQGRMASLCRQNTEACSLWGGGKREGGRAAALDGALDVPSCSPMGNG